jgi:hypothetical protein
VHFLKKLVGKFEMVNFKFSFYVSKTKGERGAEESLQARAVSSFCLCVLGGKRGKITKAMGDV